MSIDLLIKAATEGDLVEAQRLLDSGKVDVNGIHPTYKTSPICIAAQQGHLKLMQLLKERGAILVGPLADSGHQIDVLYWVLRAQNSEKRLAMLDWLQTQTDSLVSRRLTENHLKAMRGEVYESTQEFDAYGLCPAHYAAMINHPDLIKLSLNELNLCSTYSRYAGITPLWWLIFKERWEELRLLMQPGVALDWNAAPTHPDHLGQGVTAFWLLILAERWEELRLLMQQGAMLDWNAAPTHPDRPDQGITALHMLLQFRQFDLFQMVLSNLSSLEWSHWFVGSPTMLQLLMVAPQNGHAQLLKQVIQKICVNEESTRHFIHFLENQRRKLNSTENENRDFYSDVLREAKACLVEINRATTKQIELTGAQWEALSHKQDEIEQLLEGKVECDAIKTPALLAAYVELVNQLKDNEAYRDAVRHSYHAILSGIKRASFPQATRLQEWLLEVPSLKAQIEHLLRWGEVRDPVRLINSLILLNLMVADEAMPVVPIVGQMQSRHEAELRQLQRELEQMRMKQKELEEQLSVQANLALEQSRVAESSSGQSQSSNLLRNKQKFFDRENVPPAKTSDELASDNDETQAKKRKTPKH